MKCFGTHGNEGVNAKFSMGLCLLRFYCIGLLFAISLFCMYVYTCAKVCPLNGVTLIYLHSPSFHVKLILALKVSKILLLHKCP